MLNDEEKKYLSSTRLSVKINYVEIEENYSDENIFYYYGKGIIISTINNETYIDKNYYTKDKLIQLLNSIFSCVDTIELILPEEFLSIDIINQAFYNLTCKTLTIDGKEKVNLEQLIAINNNCDIRELKVPDLEKNITNNKFNFKIIPNINNQFTSKKFKDFVFDDILHFKNLSIELPLKEDYTDDANKNISEKEDLEKIIDALIDIDTLSITVIDNGKQSIEESLEIIDKIEKSIGSKIENIYYITGNRNIDNIEILKTLENDHRVSIMYDKEIICSIDDFINMRNHINKMVNELKKFELSPLEKVLYVYDIIKDFYIINHKYMKEKKVSRLIHRIFKVNELNCQAYAALYSEILRELKIEATDFNLYSPLVEELFLTSDNHARTMIHLVDNKYKIDGLFSTDVVWDAIKKIKKNYHYEFFLTRISNLKRQYSLDKFHNDIEILFNNISITDLSEKEKQVYERLLNKNNISNEDIENLKKIMKNNISLKDFLYSLSAVRVAQGRDKKVIKEELVAIVNRTNKKEKFTDKFYNADEDLKYLDITLPD